MQHAFARLVVLGHHDKLGEVRERQLLRDEKKEPGRAAADVGGVVQHLPVLCQDFLEALRGGFGFGKARSFRKPHVDDQLGPVGEREELSRHKPECGDTGNEERKRRNDHQPSMLDAPIDGVAQAMVEGRVEHVPRPRGVWRSRLEDAITQVGRKNHRAYP